MDNTYWRKQCVEQPLFPDVAWSRPEQKSLAGKITIIGGNSNGFVAPSQAFHAAADAGIGASRIVLPKSLAKVLPPNQLENIFVATNPSGGLSKESLPDVKASVAWADGTLLIGDSGRNSETAIVFETLLREFSTPFVITRDAIDLLQPMTEALLERENTCIVASFSQLQKILRSVYFTRQVLFSQPLMQVVETIHKVTITYPVILVTYHQGHLIAAKDGQVITIEFENPMASWRGTVATKLAVWWIQQPKRALEAIATSFI